jgi:hypothetical protein
MLADGSRKSDLDGALVYYVDLEGVEKVEGRDTYGLKLTMRGGQLWRLWVDAQTFLETKIEGVPRRMGGKMRHVEIYFHDYKNVKGLMLPYVLETTAHQVRQSQQDDRKRCGEHQAR